MLVKRSVQREVYIFFETVDQPKFYFHIFRNFVEYSNRVFNL